MERTSERNSGSQTTHLYREQLITVESMESFKADLFQEMRKMLNEFAGKSGKKWLKSYELKKLLGISSGTLQNLRINGTLPFTKIGGVILYDYEEVEAMLKAHSR